ncbi:MAG TPA: helix-turn-helix transcriptional regulator, partial [Flavobacteriales bacterium]|nr:helix-turn-helix transcriptional regulator [Flavobacteriales bacterium]
MSGNALQLALFKQIKARLPAHLSLAEELATLLDVSADSAYRRIRGEKPLDIQELALLAKHFGLSIDGLIGQQAGGFLFTGPFVEEEQFSFAQWLSSLNAQLELAADGPASTFIFQSKDVPLFHHFQVPELSLFKFFFWRKTILQLEGAELDRFDLAVRDEPLLALGKKVFLTYCRMPSTEIWNAESMNSTVRQINYYRETGVFRREEEAQLLFDQCLQLLDHLERQAEHGRKFPMDVPPEQGAAAYQLYHNEVLLGDNAIYADNG